MNESVADTIFKYRYFTFDIQDNLWPMDFLELLECFLLGVSIDQ